MIAAGTDFGQYSVQEALDQGRLINSYRAFGRAKNTPVTLVVLDPVLTASVDFAAYFRGEIARLEGLRHLNIVPVLDFGEFERQFFLVYPLLPGDTLREYMRGKVLPIDEAIRLLAPIATALDFAHERGVVHSNLKPNRILMSLEGRPMLLECGLARLLERAIAATGQAGALLGTPAYMAPEQVQGNQVDGRADQYALGIIAYQMLTGTVPFSGPDPEAVAWMHVRDPLTPPSAKNPAIGPAVEAVLVTVLAKNPGGRFSTCGAFAAALNQAFRTPASTPARGTIFVAPPQPVAVPPTVATPIVAPTGPIPSSPPPPFPPASGTVLGPGPTATPPAFGARTGVSRSRPFPVFALIGLPGFALAIVATFLKWLALHNSRLINGWHNNARFQLADWAGQKHGGLDGLVIVGVAALGFALLFAVLFKPAPALAVFVAIIGALVTALGVAELTFIVRFGGQSGIDPGYGIYVLIAGGALATICAFVEGLRGGKAS